MDAETEVLLTADTPSNTVFRSRMRVYNGYDEAPTACGRARTHSTSSLGFRTVRSRSIRTFTRLNTDVLAPTASASEATTTTVNTGLARIDRKAYRRSRPRLSSALVPSESRYCSFTQSTLPRSRRAR